jgi:hypothetical protein
MAEQPTPNSGRPLPPLVEGWCPWKERDADGTDRICMLLEGHDGNCDMQEPAS